MPKPSRETHPHPEEPLPFIGLKHCNTEGKARTTCLVFLVGPIREKSPESDWRARTEGARCVAGDDVSLDPFFPCIGPRSYLKGFWMPQGPRRKSLEKGELQSRLAGESVDSHLRAAIFRLSGSSHSPRSDGKNVTNVPILLSVG